MFKMLAQFFDTIRTFLMAGHHIAEWAEETAKSFAEEARQEREAKANEALKKLRSEAKPALVAPAKRKAA
jgi:uncharacterized membrane protein (DUF106 family)